MPSKSFKTPIFTHEVDMVGLKFRMKRDARVAFAAKLPKSIVLIREQTNKYDLNAIMVKDKPNGEHYGYLSAEVAAILAPLMDNREDGGFVFKSGKLLSLDPDTDHSAGRLSVEFYDYRAIVPTV